MIRLQCGEQTFEVGLAESREGLAVTVAGTTHRIAVEEVGPGVFVLAEGDRRETFHCVAEGDAVHLDFLPAQTRLYADGWIATEGTRP